MTPAERMRRVRQNLAKRDYVGVLVNLSRDGVAFVDAIAESQGKTRSQIVDEMLNQEMWRRYYLIERIKKMQAAGASEEEIMEAGYRHMTVHGPDDVLSDEQKAAIRGWKEGKASED